MMEVKKQSQLDNSSASLSTLHRAGVFFPRQLQSAFDSSTFIALNFAPSLLRMAPSTSGSSLKETASDHPTSSRNNVDTGMKRKRSGSKMSRSQVTEVVRLILCSFSSKIPDPHTLKEDSKLSTDFGFDNLDRINLLKALEKSFCFKIFEDDFDNFEKQLQTPRHIVNFICRKLGVSC
ncbi:unnamed protein product [Hymenolepis diminuta]|uniref:Acyl carrier protein, mitochondrial n=1 Tax=Hymenolepis diminuta TaxID=6216 RepID=A0A0R3S9L8_HYMDI|nr:unnamed protein product [Hymenolepis diminuta]VUZ41308.1 unnamed protein product [Hymenolepis diminuta]VUZ41311.1 unnamed protein product [Hymenolepis diminuta]VUZ50746.1 unnamed protein product [Hymenolepis diminuta]